MTPQNQNKTTNHGNSGNNRQNSGNQNYQGSPNTRSQGTQNKDYPNQGKGGKSHRNNYNPN